MRGTIAVVGLVCSLLWGGCAKNTREFSEEQYNRDCEAKQVALERLLGPMENLVGHSVIPFAAGGSVDLYYFAKGIPGTGFATMELTEPDGSGPKPNRIGTYELVTFTKLPMPPAGSEADPNSPFDKMEERMCHIMTIIGRYSRQAVLNPGETCEFPPDGNDPGLCLIFDEYRKDGIGFEVGGQRRCLLLCLEVFRSEMEYAMRHGSAVVLQKLKQAGYYPYSDLDREPLF